MKKAMVLLLVFIANFCQAQNIICKDTTVRNCKTLYVQHTYNDTFKVAEKSLEPISDSCIYRRVWWPRKRCWTYVMKDTVISYEYFLPEEVCTDSSYKICHTPPPTFGAMIFGSPNDLPGKDSVLKRLGVNTVRETILIEGWPNNKGRLKYWVKNGYNVVLNINYMAQQTPTSIFLPSYDTAKYRMVVKEILQEFTNVKVVVVENEEVNKSYRNWDKTSLNDYLSSLKIANEVCNELGVKCTNGGLLLNELKSLTKRWLDGLSNEYIVYNNLLTGPQFFDSLFLGVIRNYESNGLNPNYEDKRAKTDWLIGQYKSIGLDYINIHMYFPLGYRGSGIASDGITTAVGFKEIVAYLRSRTHIPIISNEIGSVNEDTGMIINMIEAYNYEGLDYMIYYSGKDLNNLLAKPLHNGDGSINSQGIIFKNTIKP